MLNLFSLGLGLTAWILAIAGLMKPSPWIPFLSFSCCAFSILCQFAELIRQFDMGDYSAVDDTIAAVLFGVAPLTAVTVLVNLLSLAVKSVNR